MFKALLLLVPIGLITLTSEYLWRKKVLRGEGGRKFIHILSGIWIGFWPYFVSYGMIQLLGLLLVVGMALSQSFHIFHAVHDKQIKRWTIGEFFYPLAVLVCALVGPAKWIFLLAMFYLAVADGLAAVFGTRYKGAAHFYKIFGQTKSILGTGVYVLSALIFSLTIFWLLSPDNSFMTAEYILLLLLLIPPTAVLENLLPYGIDNLVIPAFVVLTLANL